MVSSNKEENTIIRSTAATLIQKRNKYQYQRRTMLLVTAQACFSATNSAVVYVAKAQLVCFPPSLRTIGTDQSGVVMVESRNDEIVNTTY